MRIKKCLPSGEYRSHMLIQSLPPEGAGRDLEVQEGGDIRIQLVPVLGVSIPIIVRHGKLSSEITLSELDLVKASEQPDSVQLLTFKINREGTQSVFGDTVVKFKSSKGEELEVGRINGLAVYVPNKSRTMRIPLHAPEGVVLKSGNFHIIYREDADSGDAIFAEADLQVP